MWSIDFKPRQKKRRTGADILTVAEMRKGQQGKILKLAVQDGSQTRKMMAMGVLPGMTLRLIQKAPSYVLQIGETQIAVDFATAKNITVSIEKEP